MTTSLDIIVLIIGLYSIAGFVFWKLWTYRNAIIQLQNDLWGDEGIVADITKPHGERVHVACLRCAKLLWSNEVAGHRCYVAEVRKVGS